jgi:ribonuclease E
VEAVAELAEDEAEGDAATPADELAKKKRTRRGSRGGRGRKKTPAAGTAELAPGSDDSPDEGAGSEPGATRAADGRNRAPRIHVPAPDLALDGEAPEPAPQAAGDEAPSTDGEAPPDGEAPKKRTRRGTRGGRKRRKPSANGPAGAAIEADEPSVEVSAGATAALAEAVPGEEPYVPMSEWIEDFDRRR